MIVGSMVRMPFNAIFKPIQKDFGVFCISPYQKGLINANRGFMEEELKKIYDNYYSNLDKTGKRQLTIMTKIVKEKLSSDTMANTIAAWLINPQICGNVNLSVDLDWQPKELFEKEGTQVIGWLSTNKGFPDTTAMLLFYQGRWNWGDDGETPVKKPEFIQGVKPWPDAPLKYSEDL